jgi:hypothetical protein
MPFRVHRAAANGACWVPLLVAVILSGVAGCGSGSGNVGDAAVPGTSQSVSRDGSLPVASQMRVIALNDFWRYQLARNIDPAPTPFPVQSGNGFPSVTFDPLLDPQIANQMGEMILDATRLSIYPPQPDLLLRTTYRSQPDAGWIAFGNYFRQDPASGGISYTSLGNFGALREPVENLPGTWTTGLQFERTMTGTNDQTVHMQFAILGVEMVECPLGRFQTWKTAITYEYPRTGGTWRSEGTYWYAPELGSYIKARVVRNEGGVKTVTDDLLLIETNTLTP